MICKLCYIELCRLANMLLGGSVPMDALGCETGCCDTFLHDKLLELIEKRREERWNNDKST